MRVLISDARQSVRNALQLLLRQADMFVIETAATPQELIEKSKELRPDLILLDWELGGEPAGKTLVALLHTLDYRPLIVTLSIDPEARIAALTAGADAFISKSDSPEQVLHVLETIVHPGP
jgi:DNA-binding NarL/FixJ family response regulator